MVYSIKNHHPTGILLRWTLATFLMWFLMEMVYFGIRVGLVNLYGLDAEFTLLLSPVEQGLLGLGVGIIQWRVLKKWLDKPWPWIPVTLIGWLAAWFFGSLLPESINLAALFVGNVSAIPLISDLFLTGSKVLSLGIMIGLVQWLYLLRISKRSWIWPILTILAFISTGVLRSGWWKYMFLPPLVDGGMLGLAKGVHKYMFWESAMIGIGEGLAVGLLTGIGLQYILQPVTDREKDQK